MGMKRFTFDFVHEVVEIERVTVTAGSESEAVYEALETLGDVELIEYDLLSVEELPEEPQPRIEVPGQLKL